MASTTCYGNAAGKTQRQEDYRIKVFIAGAPDVLLGIADVDPMANLSQWRFTLTGDVIQLIDNVMFPIPFRVEKVVARRSAAMLRSAHRWW